MTTIEEQPKVENPLPASVPALDEPGTAQRTVPTPTPAQRAFSKLLEKIEAFMEANPYGRDWVPKAGVLELVKRIWEMAVGSATGPSPRPSPVPTGEGETTSASANIIPERIHTVEIGVYGGMSYIPQAMALAAAQDFRIGTGQTPLESAIVSGIDPWRTAACAEGTQDPAGAAWWKGQDMGVIFSHVARLIQREKLSEFTALYKCKSAEAVGLFKDGSLDLVHIDGNHSPENAQQDVALYLPKVRPGGYIAIDDANWSGVQGAVWDIEDRCELVLGIEKKWLLFRKR